MCEWYARSRLTMSLPDRWVPPIQLLNTTTDVDPLHSGPNPILNVLSIPGTMPYISEPPPPQLTGTSGRRSVCGHRPSTRDCLRWVWNLIAMNKLRFSYSPSICWQLVKDDLTWWYLVGAGGSCCCMAVTGEPVGGKLWSLGVVHGFSLCSIGGCQELWEEAGKKLVSELKV